MPLLIALVFVFTVGWAARMDFAPAVRLRAVTLRAGNWIRRYASHAPATTGYLFVVTVTAWVLATSSEGVDDALLRSHSSNLAALAQSPMRGLVQSAFWVDGPAMFVVAWVLGLVLMPVERWLATRRWVVVFALGHGLTTLVVATAMWLSIRAGLVHSGVRHVVDVGVSYGFAAVAGVLAYRFPPPTRGRYIAGALVVLMALFALVQDFTSFGHLVAFAVGLGCHSLATHPEVRARSHDPYFGLAERREMQSA